MSCCTQNDEDMDMEVEEVDTRCSSSLEVEDIIAFFFDYDSC